MPKRNRSQFLRHFLQYSPIKRLYFYYRNSDKRDKAKRNIERFLGDGVSKKEKRRHLRSMRHAYILYAWGPDEYFFYSYNRLSRLGKKEFMTDVTKDYFCERVNSPEVFAIFDNKIRAYQIFKEYYQREVCPFCDVEKDIEAMTEFISRHNDFIVKPLSSSMGEGVQKVHGNNIQCVLDIMDEYKNGIIAEEIINQGSEMSIVHPESVNTVRIATYVINGKVNILRASVRFGRGDAVIDNASRGGVIGSIDLSTGIITAVCDKLGHRYIYHPDTGQQILGFQMPQWNDALQLAERLARVVHNCKYVGWDLAYSVGGWVMVEGNSRGQFGVYQIPSQRGIRKELEALDPKALRF